MVPGEGQVDQGDVKHLLTAQGFCIRWTWRPGGGKEEKARIGKVLSTKLEWKLLFSRYLCPPKEEVSAEIPEEGLS